MHCKPENLRVGLLAVAVLALTGLRARSAPPYFQRLIDAGNVEFEFYDPRTTRYEHLGHIQFHLYVYQQSTFEYDSWVRRGSQNLTIRPTVGKITYRLTNTIRLPERFDSDRRWGHSLVEHEFDHVAMTTDPRVRMLMERLYRGIRRIERNLDADATIDNRLVVKIVAEEIAPRRQAVLETLIANQELLDDVTRHGARPVPDRAKFFRRLFGGENLRKLEFPYLSDVAGLLKMRSYQNVELPYRLED